MSIRTIRIAPYVSRTNPYKYGPVAQWLEQWTHNPLVVGSNPTGPTFRKCGDAGTGIVPALYLAALWRSCRPPALLPPLALLPPSGALAALRRSCRPPALLPPSGALAALRRSCRPPALLAPSGATLALKGGAMGSTGAFGHGMSLWVRLGQDRWPGALKPRKRGPTNPNHPS